MKHSDSTHARKNDTWKRLLSCFLSLVLVAGLYPAASLEPIAAFAQDVQQALDTQEQGDNGAGAQAVENPDVVGAAAGSSENPVADADLNVVFVLDTAENMYGPVGASLVQSDTGGMAQVGDSFADMVSLLKMVQADTYQELEQGYSGEIAYIPVEDGYAGAVYYRSYTGTDYDIVPYEGSASGRYLRSSTRIGAAETMVDAVAGQLLEGDEADASAVSVSLVTFGADASLALDPTGNAQELSEALRCVCQGADANWQAAFNEAGGLAFKGGASNAIVFITANNPNCYLEAESGKLVSGDGDTAFAKAVEAATLLVGATGASLFTVDLQGATQTGDLACALYGTETAPADACLRVEDTADYEAVAAQLAVQISGQNIAPSILGAAPDSLDLAASDESGDELPVPMTATATGQENAYAMLYESGIMVFQRGNAEDTAYGTLKASYTGFEGKTYSTLTAVPWYENRTSITSVVSTCELSSTNTKNWFYGATNLVSAQLPSGVTTVGDDTFDSCTSLTTVTFPESVAAMGQQVFFACTSLAAFNVPATVRSMGGYVFSNCSALTAVDLSATTITDIGKDVFNSCSKLASVKLPSTLQTIGQYAFYGCTSLASISLPGSLKTLGNHAFDSCSALTAIEMPNTVKTLGEYAFCNCSALMSARLSDALTVINQRTFSGCSSLVTLHLPESLVTIGNYAFSSCTSLVVLDVPDAVQTIGDYSFEYCSTLQEVNLPDTLKTIAQYAFRDCKGLVSMRLPASVTTIGYRAFRNTGSCIFYIPTKKIRSMMSNAEMSDSMRMRGAYQEGAILYYVDTAANGAWIDGCVAGVTALVIPETLGDYPVAGIAGSSFQNNTALTSVSFAEGCAPTTIEYQAFLGCSSLAVMDLPDSISAIGQYAFSGCTALASIHLPAALKTVEQSLFDGCTALKAVDLPAEVTYIGTSAFKNCKSLTRLTIPSGSKLKTVQSDAFTSATSCLFYVPTTAIRDMLNKIIQSEMRFRGSLQEGSVLYYTEQLTDAVSGVTSEQAWVAGCVDGTTALAVPATPGGVPVAGVAPYAFYGNKTLTSVSFAANCGAIAIGNQSFYGCSALSTVDLPCAITSMGTYALSDCAVLASVHLPDSLTAIPTGAFSGCVALASINIPTSVESIGDRAFYGCKALTSLELPAAVTTIGASAFYGCAALQAIEVPDSVETIGMYAFQNCTALTTAYLSDSITTVSESLFNGCTSLTAVDLPAMAVTIGKNAFSGCKGLATVNLPASVTTIQDYAFQNCSKLTAFWIPEGSQLASVSSQAFSNAKSCHYYVPTVAIYNIICSATSNAYSRIHGSMCEGDVRYYVQAGSTPADDKAWVAGCVEGTSELVIPASLGGMPVAGVASRAFYNNSTLTSLSFDADCGVTSISAYAFSGCTNLKSVELSAAIATLGQYAFGSCKNLMSVSFMEGSKISSATLDSYAFDSVNNQCVFYVPSKEVREIIYNKVTRSYQRIKGSLRSGDALFYIEQVFDDGGTTTNERAWLAGCVEGTTSLFVPADLDGVPITGIAEYAFYSYGGNTALKEIVFEEGCAPTSIEAYAFSQCTGLAAISIPEGVTSIGSHAFYGCTSLASVSLPSTLVTVGASAFYNCSVLGSIVANGATPATLGSDAFYNIKNGATIYVDASNLDAYSNSWRSNPGRAYNVKYSTAELLLPPSYFTVNYALSKSVSLSWGRSAGQGVVKYGVYRDDVKIAEIEGLSYVDTSVEPGQQYAYAVKGITSSGVETAGMSAIASTLAPQISKMYTDNPANKVRGTANTLYVNVANAKSLYSGGVSRATVSFAYADAAGDAIVIGDSQTVPSSVSGDMATYAVPWDVSGLAVGDYAVTVTVTDADGTASTMTQTFAVDASVPQKLAEITALGDTKRISVGWSLASELDTVGYRVYRRAATEESFSLVAAIGSRTTLSYTDTKVAGGVHYFYYVTGVNWFGDEGVASDIAEGALSGDYEPPSIVQFTPENQAILAGQQQIFVRATDDVSVVLVVVEVSADNGGTWREIGRDGGDRCTCSLDTTAFENGPLQVRAVATDGKGNKSSVFTRYYTVDNAGPEKVTGVAVKERTDVSITLEWKNVADHDLDFFRVEEKQSDGTFAKLMDVTDTLGANILGLDPQTEHTYRVVAYDARGNRGIESDEVLATTLADVWAPVVRSISPAACYVNGSLDMEFTATDEHAIAFVDVQVSQDRETWTKVETLTAGEKAATAVLAYTLDTTVYPEGALYVRGVAQDYSGNRSNSTNTASYNQYLVDRTAPAALADVSAEAVVGAITVTWAASPEDDIQTYQLERSADGQTWTSVFDGYQLGYNDTSAQNDVSYLYRARAVDRAGNAGAWCEPIVAMLPTDVTPPRAYTIYPVSGSLVGPNAGTVIGYFSDDWQLASASISYAMQATPDERIVLATAQNIAMSSSKLKTSLPRSLPDGAVVNVYASCTDISGNKSEDLVATYTVDSTAPQMGPVTAKVLSEGGVEITWDASTSTDVAGYYVNRKETFNGTYVRLGSRAADGNLTFYDNGTRSDTAYYYQVCAVDEVGNERAVEIGPVRWVSSPRVNPVLSCEYVMQTGAQYAFDASGSSATRGIASYAFDFGDGTDVQVQNSPTINHTYATAGVFAMKLTVTDAQGLENTVTRSIEVKDPQLVGTVRVKLVDGEGYALQNMPVYFDLTNSPDNVKLTGFYGTATFEAKAGNYCVGSYADGYLPTSRNVVVAANTTTDIVLTLVEEPVVTGIFEVRQMTLEEIVAAQIDIDDPENHNVVEVSVDIAYGPETFQIKTYEIDDVIQGNSVVIHSESGGDRKLILDNEIDVPKGWIGGGSGSGGGSDDEVDLPSRSFMVVLDMPVEASALKEFFDVKLHIINNADDRFALLDNTVTLNVPEGMTLMDGVPSCDPATVSFGAVAGKQTHTVNWILRGDKVGSYDLSADYSGTLDTFNAPVTGHFTTDTPIDVYGLSALTLVVDVNKYSYRGNAYLSLSLENTSKNDVNMPTLNIVDNLVKQWRGTRILAAPEDVDDSYLTAVLEASLSAAYLSTEDDVEALDAGTAPAVLAPGQRYTREYCISGIITDFGNESLSVATVAAAEGSGMQVELNIINNSEDGDDGGVALKGLGESGGSLKTATKSIKYLDGDTEYTADVEFGGSLFGRSSLVPSSKISLLAAAICAAAESDTYHLVNAYHDLGCKSSDIYLKSYKEIGGQSYSIASLPLGSEDSLVIVNASGTMVDGISTDELTATCSFYGDTAYSYFNTFQSQIWNDLLDYMTSRNLTGGNAKILICGHNLGAAAANLLAAGITAQTGSTFGVEQDDVYAYTFGSINSIARTDYSGRYNNLFNVINFYDYQSAYNGSKAVLTGSGPMRSSSYFKKYGHICGLSRNYVSDAGQTSASSIQSMRGYLHAVANNYVSYEDSHYVLARQACPVDIEILENGVVVGRIVDNVVDPASTIPMTVDGEVKYFLLQEGHEYTIRTVGNGVGTMDVSIDPFGGSDTRAYEYADIAVTEGLRLSCDVSVSSVGYIGNALELNVVDGSQSKIGTVGADGSVTWEPGYGAAAQIGQVEYDTLAKALAAVPVDALTTVTLLRNEVVEGAGGVTIASGKKVILNLNGHTLQNNVSANGASQVIANAGSLEIVDRSAAGGGVIANAAAEGSVAASWWGTAQSENCASVIVNTGTLVISGGTVQNTAAGAACYAVINDCARNCDPQLSVTGGSIESAGTAVALGSNASHALAFTMTSGTISGVAGIEWNLHNANPQSAKMQISGGEIRANTNALYIKEGSSEGVTDYASVIIQIMGGGFGNGAVTTGSLFSLGILNGFISGGSFTQDVSGLVASGYQCSPAESGYAVSKASIAVPADSGKPSEQQTMVTVGTRQEASTVRVPEAQSAKKDVAQAIQTEVAASPLVDLGAEGKAVEEDIDADEIAEMRNTNAALNQLFEQAGGLASVNFEVRSRLDVEVQEVALSGSDTAALGAITLGITPRYNVWYQTSGEEAAPVYGEDKELEVTKPVTIAVPVPAGYTASGKVTVIHEKEDGATHTYDADYDPVSRMVTFINPNGFSTFKICFEGASEDAVAQIELGDDVYLHETLAAALDAAETMEGARTVRLLANVDVTGNNMGAAGVKYENAMTILGVEPGVTLELGDHKLAANIVLVFGDLVASEGGTLTIDQSRLVYSQSKDDIAAPEGMNTGTYSTPVYDKATGAYSFYQATKIRFANKAEGTKVAKLSMKPEFEGDLATAKQALVASGATFNIFFQYGNGTTTNQMGFRFSDVAVESYVASDNPKTGFYLIVTGVASADITAYGYIELPNGFIVSSPRP